MDNPRARIETEFGNIIIELYPQQAPATVSNFLRYVDENRFAGACFYRVVRMDNQPDTDIRIEVIQGGLKDDEHPQSLPTIIHETTAETGILHNDGAISDTCTALPLRFATGTSCVWCSAGVARNEPGTASSEFFICINDQPELDFGGKRNPDGQGFGAFGRVIEGMDVVRKIQSQPADGQYLLKDIAIDRITRND